MFKGIKYVFLVILCCSSFAFSSDFSDENIIVELKNRNYKYLDAEFIKLLSESEKDILIEPQLSGAVYSFYRGDKNLGEYFDGWVQSSPASPFAYLSRGVHNTKMGWLARGTKYIKDTSSQQKRDMKFYFEAALMDFDQAKKLNSRIVHIYAYEMEIAMGLGQRDKIEQKYSEALKINPYSTVIASYYISSLVPRWGGSYEEMKIEINKINKMEVKNPDLKLLGGRIAIERAFDHILKRDYQAAVDLSNEALSFGLYWQYLSVRGDAYSRLKNMDMAIKDFEQALLLKPNMPNVRRDLALNYLRKGLHDKAIEHLTYSFGSEPNDAWGRNLRGICYLNSGKYENALLDFSLAVELDPTNVEYLKNKTLATSAVNSISKTMN